MLNIFSQVPRYIIQYTKESCHLLHRRLVSGVEFFFSCKKLTQLAIKFYGKVCYRLSRVSPYLYFFLTLAPLNVNLFFYTTNIAEGVSGAKSSRDKLLRLKELTAHFTKNFVHMFISFPELAISIGNTLTPGELLSRLSPT